MQKLAIFVNFETTFANFKTIIAYLESQDRRLLVHNAERLIVIASTWVVQC